MVPKRAKRSSCNSWQETQFSHCVNRGSGHVDRDVCRDDCLAQRHGDGAGGGVQGPTAARRRVIAQHRAVIGADRENDRNGRGRGFGGRYARRKRSATMTATTPSSATNSRFPRLTTG